MNTQTLSNFVTAAALVTVANAGRAQSSLVIYESGWTVRQSVTVVAPWGAHYNPRDGSVYVALRGAGVMGLNRINPNGSVDFLVPFDNPAAVVVDYDDGDVFVAENSGGALFRVGFGELFRTTWVSGFHSGDDDPLGMAIAPNDYTGTVLLPGQALVVDEGWSGPETIYRWNPDAPEGEALVKGDDGTLSSPYDIAIGRTEVYLVDFVSPTGWIYRLLPGGVTELVQTNQQLPILTGIAIDPLDQSLLAYSYGQIFRVHPSTGFVNSLLAVVPATDSVVAGVDVSPDGRLLIVTDRAGNRVHILERSSVASYCTAKVDSLGCAPQMWSNGTPSVNALEPFWVMASGVQSQKTGILFYGFATNASPWNGGTLCVGAPIQRTTLQASGGTPAGGDCSGSFQLDFNARIQSGVDPLLVVGADVFAQHWYRDPNGSFGVGISDALSFDVTP